MGEQSSPQTYREPMKAEPNATIRRAAVFGIYSCMAMYGVQQAVAPNDYRDELLASWAMAAGVSIAVTADACLRDRPLPHGAQFWVFCTWPIAAPAYLLGTQGLRGAWRTLMHAVLLIATLMVGYACALYARPV